MTFLIFIHVGLCFKLDKEGIDISFNTGRLQMKCDVAWMEACLSLVSEYGEL